MAILSFRWFGMIWQSLDFHKMAITFYLTSKWKTKHTLFYETLKVEEEKVPLGFHLEAKWKSYSYFVISMIWNDFAKFRFSQNGHNFFILPPNEKLKVLSFIQLLKFHKTKCLQFFIWRSNQKVLAILWKSDFGFLMFWHSAEKSWGRDS